MRLPAFRLAIAGVVLLAACDSKTKDQLRTLARSDSLRTDSLVSIKNDLLNEVMTSTQFVNDLNSEMAKLKSHKPARLATRLSNESGVESVKEERAAVVSRIHELVARLDSSEARVATLRARATRLSRQDSSLLGQVARYEKTITELRQTVEQQKADYEATIAKQNTQIVMLSSRVDTITREKTALTDTVQQLTAERNTVYYVVGTKDDLVKEGVLVEEGHKRFLLVGGRPVSLARDLDTTKFTKIDRQRDRVINLPDGEFTVFSRQNLGYASPFTSRDGKILGGLRIDAPDRFWQPSKFLILVKS